MSVYNNKNLITTLAKDKNLPDEDLKEILTTDRYDKELFLTADSVRKEIYGNKVYIRGLIEVSSYCKNDCYYCGIRCSNKKAERYRLKRDEILSCCKEGYNLGFRTFVLQGGEDNHYKDELLCDIIRSIKSNHPDCAVTLSLGERTKECYQMLFDAGADRYLLRHETASSEHYSKLHPQSMSLQNRKDCLFNLKEIGYQTGSGFMVGSPYQTIDNIISDLRFLQELKPHMIGIGPYLTHKDTPFKDFENGSITLTLRLIAILRLMFPPALIPSTTALGTIHPNGREMGLKAGANVIMPNLSPTEVRSKYKLYENKIYSNEESAQSKKLLEQKVRSAGYEVVTDIGNSKLK